MLFSPYSTTLSKITFTVNEKKNIAFSFHYNRKNHLSPEDTTELQGQIYIDATAPETIPSQCAGVVEDNLSVGDHSSRTQATDTESSIGSEPSYPTTFKQVMECIVKGVDIPGLETITVEPTNDAIADCTIELPKKPWEK